MFTALGAGASALGAFIADNTPVLRQVSGWIIVLMGLALAGLVRPASFDRERRFHVSPKALGAWAPPVMGAAFAFGWSPLHRPRARRHPHPRRRPASLGRGRAAPPARLLGGLGRAVRGVRASPSAASPAPSAGSSATSASINVASGLLLAGFGLLLLTGWITTVVLRLQEALVAVGLGGLANSL